MSTPTNANNNTNAAAAPAASSTAPPGASASLYVGDLNPDVVEGVLFEAFNPVGAVASIRICRDTITRRSLGYAYINFHSVADAERALDTMNFAPIKGRPCRIMWSQRDPSLRRSGNGNIFIKNLDKEIDNKSLADTFSQFGTILSCKVALDEKGESRGYGFVHFEADEAADLAISKVNGMLINDKQVYVGHFQKRSERGDGVRKFTNIFVKNLDESVSEEDLGELLGKHGKVTSLVVMKDAEGKSKGFGFANYEEFDQAAAAVEALNGADFKGKELFVGRAQKKAEREFELRNKFEQMRIERMNKYQGVNLYVKNLDDTVDDDRLRTEFAAFGTISSAKIMIDEKGVSKGFGFVCFTTQEEATKAVTEMNGKMINQKPIYVALAQRKEVRRSQLEQQYQQRMGGAQRMMPNGMAGPNPGMYAAGAPVFYTNQGYSMYPNQGQMVPRARWTPPQGGAAGQQAGRGGYHNMPNYMMAPNGATRGGRGGGRGGRGGAQGGMPPQGMQAQGAPAGRGGRGGARSGGQQRPAAQEPLTAAALASASGPQQKQMLGERLFPLVQRSQPKLAAKITGMLLEMDNGELLVLLEQPEALDMKIQEALQVLEEHAAQQAAAESK